MSLYASMSTRLPNETQTVTYVIQAPVEFDEFLNPALSSLSKADINGLYHADIVALLRSAALRMPIIITTVISYP